MALLRTIVCVGTVAVALLAGCSQTSRVDEGTAGASLVARKNAIALMRVGAASPTCVNVAVLLGTRDGEGYRRGKVIKVANVRSLSDAPVAEVEIEPGEHHVIGYACQSDKSTMTVMDKADGQAYRTSYAHFTAKAGEVVNVGHLHFGASHIGRSAFGRPLRLDITVSDWPLSELERFKAKRPTLYAQMTTRLMVVTDTGPTAPSNEQCDRMRALQAAGKLQIVPAECVVPASPPAATVAKKPRST